MTELPDRVFPSELISIIVNPIDNARASDSLLAPAADRARDERERRVRDSTGEGTRSYTGTCVNALQSLGLLHLHTAPFAMEA